MFWKQVVGFKRTLALNKRFLSFEHTAQVPDQASLEWMGI
jgi:hypothetical protein